jgi:multicomponent Na+:H+ antiporter subunit A
LRALHTERLDMEHAWEVMLRRVDALGRATARTVQHGDLRGYLWVVLAGSLGFVLWGLVASGAWPRLPVTGVRIDIATAAVALIGLGGGLAAARSRTLLSALLAVGLCGMVAAITFMLNGAPDLALTQLAVESLVVVLLTIVLLVLPIAGRSTRTVRERGADIAVSIAFAAVVFVALLDMQGAPYRTPVSDFFGAQSYLTAFGRNVVNVILVDFRGFDTLGETTVIGLAAMFAWSLFGPRTAREGLGAGLKGQGAFILRITSRLFFWLLFALSIVVVLRGHNEIGGGFVGGLVAALAFAFVGLAKGTVRVRAVLRVHPLYVVGAGLSLALLSGLPGLFVHGEFLRHLWFELALPGVQLKQGTTLLFDFGVYGVVLGSVLAFLFAFQREAAR